MAVSFIVPFGSQSRGIYNNYSPKWRWVVLDIYRGREAAR